MILFRSWKVSRVNNTPHKKLIVLIAVITIVAGCSGGGGGGGDDAAPVNSAPAITAGCSTTNQFVDRTAMVQVPETVMGTLMATDAETPGAISYSLDVGAAGMGGPITTAKGATVTLNTVTGDFTYTPATAAQATMAAAAQIPPVASQGPRGLDSFDFRVDDPDTFSIGTETVIVSPTIMPLGDSITLGSGNLMTGTMIGDAVSYRLQLLNRLTNPVQPGGPYPFEFVGFTSSGDNLLPVGQRQHGGFPGFRDHEIAFGASNPGGADDPGVPPPPARDPPFDQYTGIFDELESIETDIVLLHIGSNPVFNPSAVATDTISILNQIGNWEDGGTDPHPVATAVMQIVNQCRDLAGVDPLVVDCSGDAEMDIAALNANVITAINGLPAVAPRPDELFFGAPLDIFGALDLGGNLSNSLLFEDDFHPNLAGYNAMGDILFDLLTSPGGPAILQRCP